MRSKVTSSPDETLEVIVGKIEKTSPRTNDVESPKQPEDERATDRDGFNEQRYLAAFPDIAEAVKSGVWASAREHYFEHGRQEARLSHPQYLSAFPSGDSLAFPAGEIDAVFVSHNGWCLIIGWISDEAKPLRALAWVEKNEIVGTTTHFARCRREDAEDVVKPSFGKLLGFWTVFHSEQAMSFSEPAHYRLWAGNECKTFQISPRQVDDRQLREKALEYLGSSHYFSNPQMEAFLQLQRGLGNILIDHNMEISNEIVRAAHVVRFGAEIRQLNGSIIVCLFGKAEFLFLQASLFSGCPEAESYEFIYVSNSPELAEQLLKEATMANRVYGVSITLVILPSNAGFGAANNAAVAQARSNRILIVNPDVLPRDRDWAIKHNAVVGDLPAEQTAIFGVPLYYDDGSLMHSGMYFDLDTAVSIHYAQIEPYEILRVEHYAKGAPSETPAFLKSRQVPAVTGAFISIDRAWFEALGGFSPEYIFGHYEDADLCLKSLQRGVPVWVHPVPFWHLEGKGSSRHPWHEGGSMVNRWHFTVTWKDFITDGLVGRSPVRLAPARPRKPKERPSPGPASEQGASIC